MISRLTASAAIFSVFATVGFAVAADARQGPVTARAASTEPMQVIVLPRVEVIGQRPAQR